MRKRVLSLCMAFVLCLTMLPAAAFAEETQSVNEAVTQSSKVAQVGEETYDTLKEALDAA